MSCTGRLARIETAVHGATQCDRRRRSGLRRRVRDLFAAAKAKAPWIIFWKKPARSRGGAAYDAAKALLTAKRDQLEALAQCLLAQAQIDERDVLVVLGPRPAT